MTIEGASCQWLVEHNKIPNGLLLRMAQTTVDGTIPFQIVE
jgi:hypothetical protein